MRLKSMAQAKPISRGKTQTITGDASIQEELPRLYCMKIKPAKNKGVTNNMTKKMLKITFTSTKWETPLALSGKDGKSSYSVQNGQHQSIRAS